jgi:hypothetical protein
MLLPWSQRLPINTELQENLLVSSVGLDGGLLALSKGTNPTIQFVDRLSTSGIWITKRSFIRSLYYDSMVLLLCKKDGIWMIANEAYRLIHDVRLQFGQLYVVSTRTNEVLQLELSGKPLHRWKFPGEGDVWHLNGIDLWNGRYVVSCFGRFGFERQYKEQGIGAGMIFDLETEEVIWDGLSYPHTPRMDSDGRQYVCDSYTHRLLRRNADGSSQCELQFPGAFTRGMAFGRNHIYVGLSRPRSLDSSGKLDQGIPNARIAVLDRATFSKVCEIDLPVAEIYDIVIAPDEIPVP